MAAVAAVEGGELLAAELPVLETAISTRLPQIANTMSKGLVTMHEKAGVSLSQFLQE